MAMNLAKTHLNVNLEALALSDTSVTYKLTVVEQDPAYNGISLSALLDDKDVRGVLDANVRGVTNVPVGIQQLLHNPGAVHCAGVPANAPPAYAQEVELHANAPMVHAQVANQVQNQAVIIHPANPALPTASPALNAPNVPVQLANPVLNAPDVPVHPAFAGLCRLKIASGYF